MIPPILLCTVPPANSPVWALDMENRFAVVVEPVGLEGIKAYVWSPPGSSHPDHVAIVKVVTFWLKEVEHRDPPAKWDFVWPCPARIVPAGWHLAEGPSPFSTTGLVLPHPVPAQWLGAVRFPDLMLFKLVSNERLAAWKPGVQAHSGISFLKLVMPLHGTAVLEAMNESAQTDGEAEAPALHELFGRIEL